MVYLPWRRRQRRRKPAEEQELEGLVHQGLHPGLEAVLVLA
jgi:hypothetical protein